MRYGVDQARRGWCEAKNVANTYHLTAFGKRFEKWWGSEVQYDAREESRRNDDVSGGANRRSVVAR